MHTIVSIPGMHCASCATLIKDVSSEFPSLKKVDVDLSAKTVTLDHDEHFDRQQWTEEIESLGDTYKIIAEK